MEAFNKQQQEEATLSRKRRHAHSHDGEVGHDDLTFELYVIAGFFIILISEQYVMTYLMKHFGDLEAGGQNDEKSPNSSDFSINSGFTLLFFSTKGSFDSNFCNGIRICSLIKLIFGFQIDI